MNHKPKYESESNTNKGGHQIAVSRRAYLKGVGVAAALSGFGLSSVGTAGASDHDEIGYGKGGYGEFGYGGINTAQCDWVELTIVVEDADGTAIDRTEVVIHDEPLKTIRTDTDGEVHTILEEGTYNVEASKNGYYTEVVLGVEATENGHSSDLLIL